eukprot:2213562-Rhodomonas_salina.1
MVGKEACAGTRPPTLLRLPYARSSTDVGSCYAVSGTCMRAHTAARALALRCAACAWCSAAAMCGWVLLALALCAVLAPLC